VQDLLINKSCKNKNFPRSVGVRRGGCHQPQKIALTSKTIKKTKWLVANTNQVWRNPPTSLWKFGLSLAVENPHSVGVRRGGHQQPQK